MFNSSSAHFPGACQYRALRLSPITAARESADNSDFPWSERHLRCVWADPAYRPTPLLTADGRLVQVENPGRWNLEAGPDFLDAILRIGPDECILRGDIELHIRPADWRHHGHAADRRYQGVIAHVTYFDGILGEPDLPAPVLQISLKQALKQIPSFSFDSLDLPAYPFANLAPSPPCAHLLKTWSPDQQGHFLDSAGEERLRLKTERLAQAMARENRAQTLYEEIMGALGYKHNRNPFHKLAQSLPLDRLRQESKNDMMTAYSLLAGVSGLLPTKTNPLWDEETRGFVRSLWDIWWRHQASWQNKTLSRSEWVLSHVRPVNHPLRRLMAATGLFIDANSPFERILASSETFPSFKTILETLQEAGGQSYWAWRSGFTSPRADKPASLIGPGRAASLLTNVIVPWIAATTSSKPAPDWLKTLPPEDDNRFGRHTAHALFGHDHNPALYHTGLRQQGLLQIFNDFCLNSRNGCRDCRLTETLGAQGLNHNTLPPHQNT
jgi:hypothetical protein